MVEVIVNAPKMYTTTLAIETRLCEAVAIPLTLDGLQSTMTSFLRIEHEDYDNESGSDTDEEGEIVTTVVDKEQRIYFKCGKYIARKCISGSGSDGRGYGGRGFNDKCNNCSKQDHKGLTVGNLKKIRIKILSDIKQIQKLMR